MDPSSSTASSFSNFLAEPSSPADKARILAAPGSAILSTISFYREPRCVLLRVMQCVAAGMHNDYANQLVAKCWGGVA
jgi:hypothetical protein